MKDPNLLQQDLKILHPTQNSTSSSMSGRLKHIINKESCKWDFKTKRKNCMTWNSINKKLSLQTLIKKILHNKSLINLIGQLIKSKKLKINSISHKNSIKIKLLIKITLNNYKLTKKSLIKSLLKIKRFSKNLILTLQLLTIQEFHSWNKNLTIKRQFNFKCKLEFPI